MITMGNDISFTRGTSYPFCISLAYDDGMPYILAEGEVLRFGVKQRYFDKEYLIERTLTAADEKNGVYIVDLTPEETEKLACGVPYRYDVGLQSGEKYLPVIMNSTFVLYENITKKGGL